MEKRIKTIEYYNQERGRNNNFNLIRFLCSSLVIFSHSYPLVFGINQGDPALPYIAQSLGGVAVEVFFIISGFLITKSFLNSASLKQYIYARLLRIYPAYLVTLVFSVLIGAYFTTLPLFNYLTHGELVTFFKDHLLLLNIHQHNSLPEVFKTLPGGSSINGSTWTLPWELWMYVSLAIVGLLGVLTYRFFALVICLAACMAYMVNEHYELAGDVVVSGGIAFTALFCIGMCFSLYQDKIYLSWIVLLLAVVGLVFLPKGNVLFLSPKDSMLFYRTVFSVVVIYGTFVIAYLPKGIIHRFNNLGDYSYGLYLYAYPIQQSIVSLVDGVSPPLLFVSSFLIALFCSILSWHFIESPCLKLKRRMK